MFCSFRPCRLLLAAMLAGMVLVGGAGCSIVLPDISHQPIVHNPFPQLSRVAVAPFFNQSDEPTVDGREFALAYYGELQAVPGFEVVPLGVTEEAIIRNHINLSSPDEARRLAKVLGVDAVVIGAVTDYSPYYPPRCGMRVEWYAANPGFHEIPAGYGLPWGTPDEEYIPAPLVFEAEMALAKAQLATQTPACVTPGPQASGQLLPLPDSNTPRLRPAQLPGASGAGMDGNPNEEALHAPSGPQSSNESESEVVQAGFQNDVNETIKDLNNDMYEPVPAVPRAVMQGNPAAIGTTGAYGAGPGLPPGLPPGWPDERGFIPPGPSPVRPPCMANDGPVITHTRLYQGNNAEFTEALESYYSFRDEARFGGWQTYLQRSNDFIRFCCHMHISEMLSARGGAGETRVVWRWSNCR
jgi:hypothetical protein